MWKTLKSVVRPQGRYKLVTSVMSKLTIGGQEIKDLSFVQEFVTFAALLIVIILLKLRGHFLEPVLRCPVITGRGKMHIRIV